MRRKNPWQVSVSIIGGGLLGEDLLQYLTADGYQMSIVDVRYTRKGDVKLTDGAEASRQLAGADLVINLLPRGKDFLDCELHRQMPESATIIDFSRPPIDKARRTPESGYGQQGAKQRYSFFYETALAAGSVMNCPPVPCRLFLPHWPAYQFEL